MFDSNNNNEDENNNDPCSTFESTMKKMDVMKMNIQSLQQKMERYRSERDKYKSDCCAFEKQLEKANDEIHSLKKSVALLAEIGRESKKQIDRANEKVSKLEGIPVRRCVPNRDSNTMVFAAATQPTATTGAMPKRKIPVFIGFPSKIQQPKSTKQTGSSAAAVALDTPKRKRGTQETIASASKKRKLSYDKKETEEKKSSVDDEKKKNAAQKPKPMWKW